MRVWHNGGKSTTKDLDYSGRNGDGSSNGDQNQEAQRDPVNNVDKFTLCPKMSPVKETSVLVTLKMLNEFLLFECVLGDAAELHEGRPAVCGL